MNKTKSASRVNATKLKIEADAADASAETNDTISSSNGTLSDEDVSKSADDGKNIIKDQEVNEAGKILENVNSTKDIEKNSVTGDIISVEDYNNKTNITDVANDEATIETKNSTMIVRSVPAPATVVREVEETPTAQPVRRVVRVIAPSVETPVKVIAPSAASPVRRVIVPPAPVVPAPRVVRSVPVKVDTSNVWPAASSASEESEPVPRAPVYPLNLASSNQLTAQQLLEKDNRIENTLKQNRLLVSR